MDNISQKIRGGVPSGWHLQDQAFNLEMCVPPYNQGSNRITGHRKTLSCLYERIISTHYTSCSYILHILFLDMILQCI